MSVAWAASHLPVARKGFAAQGIFFDVVSLALVGWCAASSILAVAVTGYESISLGAPGKAGLPAEVEVQVVGTKYHAPEMAEFEKVDGYSWGQRQATERLTAVVLGVVGGGIVGVHGFSPGLYLDLE